MKGGRRTGGDEEKGSARVDDTGGGVQDSGAVRTVPAGRARVSTTHSKGTCIYSRDSLVDAPVVASGGLRGDGD